MNYMYQPVVLFIGLRYIYKPVVDKFGRFVSYLSIVGIAFGVMALITVLSVMNGFEHKLQNKILSLIPHVFISSKIGSLDPHKFPESAIKIQGVSRIEPLIINDVILQSTHGVSVGIMLGIDPTKRNFITSNSIKIQQRNLEIGKYNIIVGKQLADNLGIGCGDKLRVIVPSINKFMFMWNLPIQRLFNVIDTFSTNSEVDSYQVLVNIRDASCLMHYPPGYITGWRLWLNKPLEVHKVNREKLPDGIKWQDWREQQGELFQAIRMEKNIIILLLGLIIIVSSFNVIASLGVMITEKKREVAVLQIQGMTPRQIMTIFIIQGASTGIIGALVGVIFGLFFSSQLNKFMSVIGVMFKDVLFPVKIEPTQIIIIMISTIVIALFSTCYPSWYASTIQPNKVLHYE